MSSCFPPSLHVVIAAAADVGYGWAPADVTLNSLVTRYGKEITFKSFT